MSNEIQLEERFYESEGARIRAAILQVVTHHDRCGESIGIELELNHDVWQCIVYDTEDPQGMASAGFEISVQAIEESTSANHYPLEFIQVVRLLRRIWQDVDAKSGLKAFVAYHDSANAICLDDGKEYHECYRPDIHLFRGIREFSRDGVSTLRLRGEGEMVSCGDPVAKIGHVYGLPVEFQHGIISLELLGITFNINEDNTPQTVLSIRYAAPFEDTICGIWIGAKAWEVFNILGKCDGECPGFERVWEYEIENNGHLRVWFDDEDKVKSILQLPSLLPKQVL